MHLNAKVERAAHADRVHRMVVHTFTEFLNMMVIENASRAVVKLEGTASFVVLTGTTSSTCQLSGAY